MGIKYSILILNFRSLVVSEIWNEGRWFILVHKGKHRLEQCHDQSVQIRFSNITFSFYLVCTKYNSHHWSEQRTDFPVVFYCKSLKYHSTVFALSDKIALALCTLAALQLSQVLVQESIRFRYIFLIETNRLVFGKTLVEDEPNIL